MSVIYGAVGSEISYFHKIWIMQGETCVVGYLGEGTSVEIVSNWDTPFADTSLESRFRMLAGVIQAEGVKGVAPKGVTTLTQFNSRQIWVGNQPYTFNLVMKFRAFTDALREVEQAIGALELMMAPNIKGGTIDEVAHNPLGSLNGRVPKPVQINFGRRQLLTDCCIRSMSVPQDKERDKSGNLIRADVSLVVETMQTVTKTDLENSKSYAKH